MNKFFRTIGVFVGMSVVTFGIYAVAQTTETIQTQNDPPELTAVSGQIVDKFGNPVKTGGAAFFLFQNRLNEISHTDSVQKAKALSETSVAVDNEGSFTLKLQPGNFAMLYDPQSSAEEIGKPGSESMAILKRHSPEQIKQKIDAIKENATKGLPIKDGRLQSAYIVENIYIRPPVIDLGTLELESTGVVTIMAKNENNEAIDFPASLRLRGKNGDIMEPHTPSVSSKGEYKFHDILPQSYQVFAIGTLPKPGQGDKITTPTLKNDQFIFTGEALDHEVIVVPLEESESDNTNP